jgi:hypothetical protein
MNFIHWNCGVEIFHTGTAFILTAVMFQVVSIHDCSWLRKGSPY